MDKLYDDILYYLQLRGLTYGRGESNIHVLCDYIINLEYIIRIENNTIYLDFEIDDDLYDSIIVGEGSTNFDKLFAMLYEGEIKLLKQRIEDGFEPKYKNMRKY
jgi:hypothetical protein